MHPPEINFQLMFLDVKNTVENDLPCQKVDKMSHIPFLCKLVTPLLENVYFAIYQLIVHIAQQLRCLTPCFEGLRSL